MSMGASSLSNTVVTRTVTPRRSDSTHAKALVPAISDDRKPIQEEVHLSATTGLGAQASPPLDSERSSAPTQVLEAPPSTLMMEAPAFDTSIEAEGQNVLSTLTQSLSAKTASNAHWEAGLEALAALPEADKSAAGKVAFYTQAASLPQFAGTLEGLPDDQKPFFPNMIFEAKEAGALNGDELATMVTEWSEKNPEQAYLAQMSGFASYAADQLVTEAVKQGLGSLEELQVGPREESLVRVSTHGNGYVRERNIYLSGAFDLSSTGHLEFAQQLVDA